MAKHNDLIIIGGGPAGLSAAVNGAAEGLSVTLLDRNPVLGGQAGTSSRIENYLGFNEGVSGSELTKQAEAQATRLGAELHECTQVVGLEHNEATGYWVTRCGGGQRFISPAVLLAVGVDYRHLTVPVDDEVRDVVKYGAPAAAHDVCFGKPVLVVGGGNSAGQAALNLAKIGAHVTLLVRRPLKHTMSRYLIERIATTSNITPLIGEVERINTLPKDGPARAAVTLTGDHDGALATDSIFVYIGSEPRTEFLDGCCSLDGKGFVGTDQDFRANETGLFVAGDVRAGSNKRVASAVGEGAIAAAKAWKFVIEG